MLQKLIQISNKQLLIPLYHAISDEPPAHLKNLYPIRSIRQFKNDLAFILNFFEPISVEDLVYSIKNQQPFTKNKVLFTFDDGLREAKDFIAPILKEKGIPAIFFVNSAFVNNNDLFYRYKAGLIVERLKNEDPHKLTRVAKILNINLPLFKPVKDAVLQVNYLHKDVLDKIACLLGIDFNDFLQKNKPYLSTDELNLLMKDGFYIGAHSIGHPEFFNITFEEQYRQVKESIIWVKENLNSDFNLFAFPFTDFNVSKQFFESIYADQEMELDLTFGCAGLKDEFLSNHLQRVPFEKTDSSAKTILWQEYVRYLLKKLIRKNYIKR
ncbi:MAG: polysaccharide deacetylase family protein [Bacteroidales bacterium]